MPFTSRFGNLIVEDEPYYKSEGGVANGVATLDGAGIVPLSQLPPSLSNNIYTADGTITGNRLVCMDGYGLVFKDQSLAVSLFRIIDSGVGLSYVEIGDNTTTGYQSCQINGILVNAGGLNVTTVNGYFAKLFQDGFQIELNVNTLLNNRTQTFQDADGTIALTNDFQTGQTYTVSNVVTTRSYNANLTNVNEIADVLGTLIADLQSVNILS